MRSINPEASQATQDLAGACLIDINVMSGYVEFVFLGEDTRTIVRVTKQFSFRVQGRDTEVFDPNFDFRNPPSKGGGDFVFLRGDHCASASLDPARLVLLLAGGAQVEVNFSAQDFEPIELVGMTGERNEKLAFYHVL